MAEKKATEVKAKKSTKKTETVEAEVKEQAVVAEPAVEEKDDKKTEKPVKAGPKARRAKEEAEGKVPKEKSEATENTSTRGPVPVTRPKSERRSKKYRSVAEKLEAGKQYSLKDGVDLARQTSTTKFDGSIELHVKLGVDPRHADQNIRTTVALPHGTGKTVRVAVFAPTDQHEAAKKAGADIVGEDDFLQLLDKEEINFDILVATPQLMAKLAKYARLLGPRGLMPNPKSGTVAAKAADAVKQAKAGRVEFRVDKQGIIHQAVGKVSFDSAKLYENAKAVIDAIQAAKPASVKGTYIQTITVVSTMGPGVHVDTNAL
jgi:large subunit ribosomal protein L1